MPTAQPDTEITLGTGRMLAIFLRLCPGLCVLLCHRLFNWAEEPAWQARRGLLSASTAAHLSQNKQKKKKKKKNQQTAKMTTAKPWVVFAGS